MSALKSADSINQRTLAQTSLQQSVACKHKDVSECRQIEKSLQARIKQQSMIAALGQLALSADNLNWLLNKVVCAITETLDVDACKILELLPDGETLLLKAGAGCLPELVGQSLTNTNEDSQSGYTLRCEHPVVVENFSAETRFNEPSLLEKDAVTSALSVVIGSYHSPYGVLEIHSIQRRLFNSHDVDFLQSIATLISQTVERIRSIRVLKQSELEYRTLTENMPGIVYRLFHDNHNHMVFLNSQCKALTGFEPTELLTNGVCSIEPLILAEDQAQVRAAINQAIATHKPFQAEYRIRDKDGQVRYFWEKGQPVLATGDQSAYIDGLIMDITDRKLAQQKVHEQAALLDVATEAIFVRSMDNRVLFWNKGAVALYGWREHEALGRDAEELLSLDELYEPTEAMQSLLRQGRWQGECQQFTRTGQQITVMSRWTLLKDKRGHPASILTVNTDITQAKQLQAQFLRAQRLESIGTLASGIAHDLNNILTPIYGVAQLLPMQLPNADSQLKQQFDILRDSAKRGSEIIGQMLSFARGVEGSRNPIQVKHLIREIRSFVYKTFPKSIDISVDIPESLWSVNGDPTQLHQIFMNLFVNARDAMPDGGLLSVSATNLLLDQAFVDSHIEAHTGPYILVTVADTGKGIANELCDRIFEPFFTTKQARNGTGLGLSTVHGIVKSHGGFISVSSKVGEGTQFKIYLPALESAEEAVEETELLPVGRGECVLVVDDEPAIRVIVRSILETHCYKVIDASDGVDAIAQYTEYKGDIDLVIMDMAMPDLDGLSAARIMQKTNSHLKAILISGLPGNADVAASVDASVGIKGFLQKPFSSEALLQAVHDALHQD